jgi:hypothetical protein
VSQSATSNTPHLGRNNFDCVSEMIVFLNLFLFVKSLVHQEVTSHEVVQDIAVCVNDSFVEVVITPTETKFLHASFRVKLVGNIICLVDVKYANNSWRGVKLVPPGRYLLEVLLVYRHFNSSNLVANCVEEPRSFRVAPPLPFLVSAGLNITRTGWHVRQGVPQEDIEALAITRSFDTQGRNWTHLRWDSAITFIDASIDDKEETTDEKTRLGVVRFVGDSQTRELYHAVLRARDLAGLHCPELVLKDSCIDPTGLFNHTWLHYPDGVVNHEQFPHTSVIVLNTGQWSLSWVHGYPESLPSYREKLKGLFTRVLQSNLSIIVTSTHPGPFFSIVLTPCPARDWRTEPIVREYNKISKFAVEELRAAGHDIQFLDLTDIVEPVDDLTMDWSHYQRGPIAQALAKRTLHALRAKFQKGKS